MLSPDQVTAYVTAIATVVGAATAAYVRWNRKAQRTLRATRKAMQQYRDGLETAVEGWAAARRIAIANGVDPKLLPKIPRKVLVLTTADDDPSATTGGDGSEANP